MNKGFHMRLIWCFVIAVAAFVALGSVRLWSQGSASLQIVNPAPQATLIEGELVNVTLRGATGTTLTSASAFFAGGYGLSIPPAVTTSPFSVSLAVPFGKLGLMNLVGIGTDQTGKRLETFVTVNVVPPSVPSAITLDPTSLFLDKAGEVRGFDIEGVFSGIVQVINGLPEVTCTSTNILVATVNSTCAVTAIAPGLATITVSAFGISTTVPVSVAVFEIRGDLDGNGRVDQNDLNILLEGLNGSSSGPGDPRDLNNDGRIDAVDARILTTLCSSPHCAVQ